MARDMYKRRRYCKFSAEGISEVDYKDIPILKAVSYTHLRAHET